MNKYPYTISWDAVQCYDLAEALLNGMSLKECLKLKDNYLTVYPFQYGIITLWEILIIFFKDNAVSAYQVIQIVMTGIANVYLYKIVKLFSKNEKFELSFLLLTLLWIIPYLMAPYAYAFGIGLSLSICSLYYFIKYLRLNKIVDIVLASIFVILAIYLKMNYAILAIAYVVYIIFIYNSRLVAKLKLIVIAVGILLLGMNSVNIAARIFGKNLLPAGVPMTAWLMMGSPIDDFYSDPESLNRNPGFYNGYNWYLAIESDYNQEKMKEIISQDFDKLTTFISNNPLKTVEFYYYKLIGTWDSRDFLANIYMTGDGVFDRNSAYLKNLDTGVQGLIIDQITNIGTSLIFLGSVAMLLLKRKNIINNEFCIIVIWFIGGFLYHMLFETKPIYVYPYVTILLPLAAIGISELTKEFKSMSYFSKKRKHKLFVISSLILLVLIFGYNRRSISINVYESYADVPTEINMTGDAIYLRQKLMVNNDCLADGIELNYSGEINDDELYYMIYDKDKVLRTGIITKRDFEKDNQWVSSKFKTLRLKANEEYTIEVFLKGNSNNDFKLIYGDSAWANGRFVEINNDIQENKVLNVKLSGKEKGRFYYYQDIKKIRINELYHDIVMY